MNIKNMVALVEGGAAGAYTAAASYRSNSQETPGPRRRSRLKLLGRGVIRNRLQLNRDRASAQPFWSSAKALWVEVCISFQAVSLAACTRSNIFIASAAFSSIWATIFLYSAWLLAPASLICAFQTSDCAFT